MTTRRHSFAPCGGKLTRIHDDLFACLYVSRNTRRDVMLIAVTPVMSKTRPISAVAFDGTQ